VSVPNTDVSGRRLGAVIRPAALAAGLVAAALLAGGCSASSGGVPLPDLDDAPEAPRTWPLTGLPGYPDDHSTPVVVVKVDDSGGSRPQLGIGAADLVVQELVEGGTTRLAVMYHAEYPALVEPVRSVRQTDIGVVQPTGGTLVGSGGERSTIAALQAAGIPLVLEDDNDPEAGFSRDPGRRAPFNLQLDVATLVGTLPPARPPVAYLPFGEVPGDAGGEPADAIALRWPAGGSTFSFDEEDGVWRRADLADAADFAFTNVVALTLDVAFDIGTDVTGTPVPRMLTEGSGSGVVATDGQVHPIRWSKDAVDQPWTFTYVPVDAATSASPDASASAGSGGDDAGEGGGTAVTAPPEPFLLPPGRTWLALLPSQGGSVDIDPAP
jgi:hypothetical protein